MSGAERLQSLGGAVLGAVPGGSAARAGLKAGLKGVEKARSLRKVEKASACLIGNSFTLDTPVLMADGQSKPIGDLAIGDEVRALDPETGEAGAGVITAVIDGDGSHTMVRIDLTDGQSLVATWNHPVWVEDERGWVNATDLRPGDLVREADGDLVAVAGVDAWHEAAVSVRNLTVAGWHTFFAGRASDAALVHNTGCGGESEAARIGRLAHKKFDEFLSGLDDYMPSSKILGSRKRPDGWKNGNPIELKPNNPRALRRGERQLRGYEKLARRKEGSGELWSYTVRKGIDGNHEFDFFRLNRTLWSRFWMPF